MTVPDEVHAALEVFGETGIVGAGLDERVGGMQLPAVVAQACFAWFHAANVGTAAYPFLTIAAANLLLTHGSRGAGRHVGAADGRGPLLRHDVPVRAAGRLVAGRRDHPRRAVRDDGTYRLTGNKMWISGGDHELSDNIVHLVLAKIPGSPAGTKGISLFVVPRWLENGERNDVVLAGLNHKMGYRGTVNTLLNFGEGKHTPGGEAGAVGYLVGEPNTGLASMFHMMNEARVGVGAGATALGYAGYLHALEYARTRPQGRPAGAKDPTSPQVPIVEHADVRRMLLASKSYVEGALALNLYCGTLLDDERTAPDADDRARAHLLLEMLTPVAKSWPSQWCLRANDLAIQIHGGYGYTREYDVEQLYRDNRLNAIHEGTHGIQGLDLLGRKVVMSDGAGLELLVSTLDRTVQAARKAGGEAAELAEGLDAAVRRVAEVTATLWGAGDPSVTLANSSVYLEAVGHVVIAWVWLEQLLAAGDAEGAFYDGKRAAARYFHRYELPSVHPQLDLLASLDRTTLDVREDWF